MSNVSQPAPMVSRSLRVMLVDDHQTVRQGLRALFETMPECQVVHEASDGETALVQVRTSAPDLLVVDLSMPRVNGLELIRQLRYLRAHTKIIVLSRYRETGYVREAFAAGARGYVLKQSPFDELRRAIEAVIRGLLHLDAALVPSSTSDQSTLNSAPASEREMGVLRRSALGDSNKEIAESLSIAVKTVEAHKSSAMKKLGLINRRQLISYAALHGWFEYA